MDTDTFYVDSESGDLVSDLESVVDDGTLFEDGSEVVDNGKSDDLLVEDFFNGSDLSSEEEIQEDSLLSYSDDISLIDLYSDEVVTALLASSPASGSLSSSTLDYFDRVVNGLSSDYIYVAYKNSSDDSYAGTIIYSADYSLSDDSIVFGKGAIEIDVSRSSSSSGYYNNYITYKSSSASDVVVTPQLDGTILYYTNAFDGFPVLGNGQNSFTVGHFLTVGLLSAMAVVVLQKLLLRR